MSTTRDGTNEPDPLAERIRGLEELYMHLDRTVRDLDQIVVQQGIQLAALGQKLSSVMELVQSLAGAQSGPPANPLDEKPPHY